MSVRVVIDVECPSCNGKGRDIMERSDGDNWTQRCFYCGGTGTVGRECRCDGCRHWRGTVSIYGTCRHPSIDIGDEVPVDADHACKAWEPRM